MGKRQRKKKEILMNTYTCIDIEFSHSSHIPFLTNKTAFLSLIESMDVLCLDFCKACDRKKLQKIRELSYNSGEKEMKFRSVVS